MSTDASRDLAETERFGECVPAGEPAGPALEVGDLVGGRYRIDAFVARGGNGEVFRATDLLFDEPIALKGIRPELARDRLALARFRREVHLARKVTHPGVCRVYDVVSHETAAGSVPVVTMELLDGETLAERLRREGPMKPSAALPIVQQIVAALAAAHAAGVIHCDLKPGNVMLATAAGRERVVLIDFSIACTAGGSPRDATDPIVACTPAYVAPEQVAAMEVTSATDIYALGVVLYEMVTGHLPFVGDTAFATSTRRLVEDPPPPRAYVPDLDAVWVSVILGCLARVPRERPQDVRLVAAALAGSSSWQRLIATAALAAGVRWPRRGGSFARRRALRRAG